jgi:hypothetical protein
MSLPEEAKQLIDSLEIALEQGTYTLSTNNSIRGAIEAIDTAYSYMKFDEKLYDGEFLVTLEDEEGETKQTHRYEDVCGMVGANGRDTLEHMSVGDWEYFTCPVEQIEFIVERTK